MVVDVDSTICEVAGKAKAGAAYGYTKVLGYHPILATRAGTGEVLHAHMRGPVMVAILANPTHMERHPCHLARARFAVWSRPRASRHKRLGRSGRPSPPLGRSFPRPDSSGPD